MVLEMSDNDEVDSVNMVYYDDGNDNRRHCDGT